MTLKLWLLMSRRLFFMLNSLTTLLYTPNKSLVSLSVIHPRSIGFELRFMASVNLRANGTSSSRVCWLALGSCVATPIMRFLLGNGCHHHIPQSPCRRLAVLSSCMFLFMLMTASQLPTLFHSTPGSFPSLESVLNWLILVRCLYIWECASPATVQNVGFGFPINR